LKSSVLVLKQDWRDCGRIRVSSRAAKFFGWRLTLWSRLETRTRRVPASSHPAHRDAAKTIPLRQNRRFVSPGLEPFRSWRGAQWQGSRFLWTCRFV